MPIFIKNAGISNAIEDIIRNADNTLILITPYLQLSKLISDALRIKNNPKLNITLVYREDKRTAKDIELFKAINAHIAHLSNLHAKCYLNESACIITSLNLYEYSEKNNHEMGVLISRSEDSILYREIWNEANQIIQLAGANNPQSKNYIPKIKNVSGKIHIWDLAKKLHTTKEELNKKLLADGYIIKKKKDGGKTYYALTSKGMEAGGELIPYNTGKRIVWPADFKF